VKASVVAGSARIGTELANTGFVVTGIGDIADRVESFGATYGADRYFPTNCVPGAANPGCVACGTPCTKLGSQVSAAVAAMRAGLKGTMENLDEAVKTMQNKITGAKDDVIAAVDTGIDAMKVLPDNVASLKTKLDDSVKKGLADTKDTRQLGVLALFAASLGVAGVGLLGALLATLCRRSACGRRFAHTLHLTWFLGCVVALVGFLVSLAMLLGSSVVGDACQFVDIVTGESLAPYVRSLARD